MAQGSEGAELLLHGGVEVTLLLCQDPVCANKRVLCESASARTTRCEQLGHEAECGAAALTNEDVRHLESLILAQQHIQVNVAWPGEA